MALTDSQCRTAKANGKIQKLSDGGGLYLQITPTGSKLRRLAYRFGASKRLLHLANTRKLTFLQPADCTTMPSAHWQKVSTRQNCAAVRYRTVMTHLRQSRKSGTSHSLKSGRRNTPL